MDSVWESAERRPRDGDLAGGIDRLGSLIPDGKKDCIKNPQKVSAHGSGRGTSGLALGLAPFIMQASESVITVCFNASLLKYGGDVAVGAMTILSSAMQFSMLPMQGLGQGAQPITSYNYGARNASALKGHSGLLLTTSLCYSWQYGF